MQYNGDLKNSVISKFNSAIKQISNCKVVHIDIPSDFEGSGTINSALSKIKAANLNAIKGEFESVASEAEAIERKVNQNALEFEFASNGFSFFSQGTKKDNHDVYHQVKEEKDKKKDTESPTDFIIAWGNSLWDNTKKTGANVTRYAKDTVNTLINFNWTDVNERAKLDEKSSELLNKNLKNIKDKTEKTQKTAWDKMLENNIKRTFIYNLIANSALKKEQQRIKEETERTQASAQNELIAIAKGIHKMGENITDFIALRTEELQEEHLRTIYSSNAEYEKNNKVKYENEIAKMRNKTMSFVAKDYTEVAFNKLYESNKGLQEIDDKAYNPFKRTGAVYKAGEYVAPAIAATTVSVVAPQAASIIIPTIIGMNSGGRASEEYLSQKKQTQNNWTTKDNLDNAIKYGNAIGLWDAAQYAIGMNLFKFNPTDLGFLNGILRVETDTILNAMDTPYKAMVYSLLDKETDFSTAFEAFGGAEAVATSAVLGLGGSLFGEFMQYQSVNNKLNKIYELQNVNPNEIDDVIKVNLRNDLIEGNINIEDIKLDENFLINYTEKKNISNLLPSEIKIDLAHNRCDDFLKEHGILWLKKRKKQTDNIKVFNTRKEFEDFLINDLNMTEDYAKGVGGVNANTGETITIAFDKKVPIGTIIHEENHTLGNCRIFNNKIVKYNFDSVNGTEIQRGIDEAFTESIKLRMNGTQGIGTTKYACNVDVLNQMKDLMNKNGYEDVDLYTFFGEDKSLFANTVNKIMKDDSFYNDLAYNMNISDGMAIKKTDGSFVYNKDDIKAARLYLNHLLEKFKNNITK